MHHASRILCFSSSFNHYPTLSRCGRRNGTRWELEASGEPVAANLSTNATATAGGRGGFRSTRRELKALSVTLALVSSARAALGEPRVCRADQLAAGITELSGGMAGALVLGAVKGSACKLTTSGTASCEESAAGNG